MKEIPLTQGQVALVDDADYETLSRQRWHARKVYGGKFYASCWVAGKDIYMHRQIIGAPAGVEVDHRNGDTLDNRRANLRRATHRQNHANRGKAKHNTSGYTGVCRGKRAGTWTANIRDDGTHRHLGTFANPRDAAIAYDTAALRLRGEFARLNFPLVRGGDT